MGAWVDRARSVDLLWRAAVALLAALAAFTLAVDVGAPPLPAAILFCVLYIALDAAGWAIWLLLRDGETTLADAGERVALEAGLWLAAAPLGAASQGFFDDPGVALAFLAGELTAGALVWALAESLAESRRQARAAEGALDGLAATLAGTHSEPRVRVASSVARVAAESLRAPAEAAARAESAAVLLAAGYRAEHLESAGTAADDLRSTLRSAQEHFDGAGPEGLAGSEIPLEARIAATVGCWLGLRRASMDSRSPHEWEDLLRSQSGRTLDPLVVQAVARAAANVEWPSEAPAEWPTRLSGALGRMALPALSEADSALFERSPGLLSAYFEILTILAADLNFDHNLDECIRVIRGAVGADKAALFLQDGDGYVLRRAQGFSELVEQRLRLPADCALLAQPGIHGDLEHSATAQQHPALARFLRGSRSALSAGLEADGRRLGVLVALSPAWNAHHEPQAQFLALASRRVAAAVASSLALERIYREAQSDPVTGLPNVRAALQRLDHEIARARREDLPLAVLFLDVDRLKPVNDRYGHRAGDRLLEEVARRLSRSMRPYDFLARVGGDEFLAILPGLRPEDVAARADQLRRVIARHRVGIASGTEIEASMSVGAANFPGDGSDADTLVSVSDRRMYDDKRGKTAPRTVTSRVAAR